MFLLTEMEHSVSFVMMHAVQHDATDSKRAIVNAARELPISEGPRVSMRAIATRAGVGVATASRHFPEKLALIDAISSAEVRRIEEKIDKQLENFPAAPEGTWRGTVHHIASLNFAALVHAASAEVTAAAFSNDEIAQITQQRSAELERLYRCLIEPAQRAELCLPFSQPPRASPLHRTQGPGPRPSLGRVIAPPTSPITHD